LAAWEPRPASADLVSAVSTVLDEYRDYLPLTLRQVFYRLVGAHGYAKDERAYDRLIETANRARRAGLIPFDAIRDDGAQTVEPDGWSDPEGFWQAVRDGAEHYRRHLQDGQPEHVELWIETGGMVPQAAQVAGSYGVPVFSGGGFDSLTAKHDAALRFCARDATTVVLHVGDHDPSGLSILDSAAADIDAFCRDYGRSDSVYFRRIAVTEAQIQRYSLATAPQKPNDRRGERMAATVQAEALAPDQLAGDIRAAIEAALDLNLLEQVQLQSKAERQAILAELDARTV
jgi:hypothetical protein